VPDVASHGQRSLAMPYSPARPVNPACIARQQNHTCSVIDKNFRDRFPDSHGSASHHHNFP
jgi:hypothetical protein